MAAKRIVVLDRDQNAPIFRVLFWAVVPAVRQVFHAAPDLTSAWVGASAEENAELASGAMKEVIETISIQPGATLAQMQAQLEARWAAFQAEVNAENRYLRYGTYWDGSAWTGGGA